MKLYFGNTTAAVTTIMIVALIGFIGYSIWNRTSINSWGRRSLFVLVYGLVVCCLCSSHYHSCSHSNTDRKITAYA